MQPTSLAASTTPATRPQNHRRHQVSARPARTRRRQVAGRRAAHHAGGVESAALDRAAGERDEGWVCATADYYSGDWGERVILFPKLNALYRCPKTIGCDVAVSLGQNLPLAMQPARASNFAVMQSCLASLGPLVVVAHLFLADTSVFEPSP
jgi:hypothetical protein